MNNKILLAGSIFVLVIGIAMTLSMLAKPQTITPHAADFVTEPTGEINKACAIKTCQGTNLLQCLPKTVYVQQGEPCPPYNQCERNNCSTPPTSTPDPSNPNPPTAEPEPTVAKPSSCPPGQKPCNGVYVCRALCGCNYSPPQCIPLSSACPRNECGGPNDDAACAGCVCTPWEYSGDVGEGGCGENARPMTRTCTENGQPADCSATRRCDAVRKPFPTREQPTPTKQPSTPPATITLSPPGNKTPTPTPPVCPLPKAVNDLIITCPKCQ